MKITSPPLICARDGIAPIEMFEDQGQLFGFPHVGLGVIGLEKIITVEQYFQSLKATLQMAKQKYGKMPSRIYFPDGSPGMQIPEWFESECATLGIEIRNLKDAIWKEPKNAGEK